MVTHLDAAFDDNYVQVPEDNLGEEEEVESA
jgi:hypothetical protein